MGFCFNLKIISFFQVAIRPNSSKNTKSFGNCRVFTLSVAASALNFQIIVAGIVYTVISDTFVSYATWYGPSGYTTTFCFLTFLWTKNANYVIK